MKNDLMLEIPFWARILRYLGVVLRKDLRFVIVFFDEMKLYLSMDILKEKSRDFLRIRFRSLAFTGFN